MTPDEDALPRSAAATLVGLFARQVRRTPAATALVYGPNHLSYAELAVAVDRVTTGLRHRGVRAGDVVAVSMPRSAELVTVLLGVMRAGAAYLPVDVGLPVERVRHLLAGTAPRCLVSGDDLSGIPGPPVPRVDPARLLAASEYLPGPQETQGARPLPADTAYVIHTSGSTGRPKGVAVSHASIVSHLDWMQRRYQLDPQDRVLHKTPLGFDPSVWELFWPLSAGAVLVVAEPDLHRDVLRLRELMRRERITTVHFVPSMLDVFVENDGFADTAELRRVIVSGEILPADLCRRVLAATGASLHNLYGPTEAAIDVTEWECPRPLAADVVPIGAPVDDTQIHILDDCLSPVGPGVPGELYIAGAQLATAYVNAPALTAERFVACPGSGRGRRMYRTGDLARFDQRGEVEYLGRTDSQIKINGVRIEPAEVEAALMRHPAVRQAAVVASAPSGEPRLSAHVCLNPRVVPAADRLVRLLELPDPVRPRVVELANGLPVCVHQESEARFMYREIFQEQVYTPAGITLAEGDCVLDIGANIGLFALFIGVRVPRARVYAAEPVPDLFEILRRNMRLHGIDAVLLPYALGERPAEAERFTYYPNVSLVSGRHADATADGSAVRDYLEGQLAGGDAAELSEVMSELVTRSLEPTIVQVAVRTVSQIIDEERIERVHLLKIDVERSELEVLAGIEERHWPLIEQVCLEAHAASGVPERVQRLLAGHGFEVRTERPDDAGRRDLVNMYAVRPGRSVTDVLSTASQRPLSLDALIDEIRAEAASVLPESMRPATVTAVSQLPLTPNGKLDRERLGQMAPATSASPAAPGRAPETERERILCSLIGQVVDGELSSVDDNIFALGGTSLAVVRLTASICRQFGVDFKFRMVLENPTAAGIARALDNMLGPEG